MFTLHANRLRYKMVSGTLGVGSTYNEGGTMGQARNRGDREERIARAHGLQQMNLNDVKKICGLSEDAKFLGYAVHLEESDEFLLELVDTPSQTSRMWTKKPELAKTYGRFDLALDDTIKCSGAIVVGIFDTGAQIFVALLTD